MRRAFWIIIISLLVLGGCGYVNVKGTQNDLVKLEESVNGQFGDLQSSYQRRADLIPNLVETAKAAANFEQQTLTQVSQARRQVSDIKVTKEVLEDPQAFQKFQQAQGELTQALSRFLSVSERYPDLKANENFQRLMAQLEGTENRINNERMRYNNAVQAYNTEVKQFPTSIYASILGFEEKAYFEAEAAAQSAPKVNFDS
jgi:LemA protein